MYKTFLAALFSPMIYIYFWANPTLDTKYTKLKLFKLQKTQMNNPNAILFAQKQTLNLRGS